MWWCSASGGQGEESTVGWTHEVEKPVANELHTCAGACQCCSKGVQWVRPQRLGAHALHGGGIAVGVGPAAKGNGSHDFMPVRYQAQTVVTQTGGHAVCAPYDVLCSTFNSYSCPPPPPPSQPLPLPPSPSPFPRLLPPPPLPRSASPYTRTSCLLCGVFLGS